MIFKGIDYVAFIGDITLKDYANNRTILFDNQAEADTYFGANFPTNTKEIYSATLFELVEKRMNEVLQSKGYPSINMPHIIVTHSIVSSASNPRVTKAKKAIKWYYDTWESVNTHLGAIGATTNLLPQTFVDSLNLPTL